MSDIKNTRIAALTLVDNERNRQDAKWGEQNHPPQYWTGILGEEYGEYCQAVNETIFRNGEPDSKNGGAENMIRELTHVAAVAVGAIECIMRMNKQAKPHPNPHIPGCDRCVCCGADVPEGRQLCNGCKLEGARHVQKGWDSGEGCE